VERELALKRHALEILSALERNVFAPLWFRAAQSDLQDHVSTAPKLDGFSLTVRVGASEKCTKPSGGVHIPFTTFPQAPEMCKSAKNEKKSKNFAEKKMSRRQTALKWCKGG
jgi:hypothetical protein